jgi:hypothetical protein
MWRQRSRIEWFSEGGKNTRFFHLRTSQRKKKNKICRLLRPDGVATENEQELADLNRDFYDNLYRSEGVENMDEVLNVVPSKVTQQMNERLLKPFGGNEIKEDLFQMFPTKAPGPDGFPAHFFRLIGRYVGRR